MLLNFTVSGSTLTSDLTKCPTNNSLSWYNMPLHLSIACLASSSVAKWINPNPFELPVSSVDTLQETIDP